MSVRKGIELLSQVPVFQEVEHSHLQLILFSAPEVRFKSGQNIIHQGEVGDAGYLLLDGSAQVMATGQDQPEMLAVIKRGTFIGELSMVARLAHHVTVKAKTPVSALKIQHELFMRVVKEFPEVGASVMHGLASKLDGTIDELAVVRELFERSETFP